MDAETLNSMRMAIEAGKLSPPENGKIIPKVGAVIVKNGKVLDSAFRGEKAPGDHAEYTLFEKKLKDTDLKGATLFTTLEPCTSRAKHKPCSDWVIEKGIGTVFIGMLDPNPKIYHAGVSKLKDAGITVRYFPHELREEIRNDNANFILQFKANPELSGTSSFDFTSNDGRYDIGSGEWIFKTRWTNGGGAHIWACTNETVTGVGIALGATKFSDITDASIYDMTSWTRLIAEHQFVVLKHSAGYFAAIQIVDVKARLHKEPRDEVTIEYRILSDKTCDFSVEPFPEPDLIKGEQIN